MGRALPVLAFELDDIQVASPCSMAWADMVGGDKVRFCGACQKNVYNLSGMARPEAMDLIQATEGRLCVRFFRRADGSILTEDCPVGLRMALKRAKKMTLGAIATSVGAIAALLAFLGGPVLFGKKSCNLPPRPEMIQGGLVPAPVPVMGEVAAPQEIAGGLRPPREIMGKVARDPVEFKGDALIPTPRPTSN